MSTTCSSSYQMLKCLNQRWIGESALQLSCWDWIQIKSVTLWKIGMKYVVWNEQILRKISLSIKANQPIQGHDLWEWYLELWLSKRLDLGINGKGRLNTTTFMLETNWDETDKVLKTAMNMLGNPDLGYLEFF